jgi:hypothetical protein
MGKSKHAPNRFSAYLEIHSSVISQYEKDRFIGFNTLMIDAIPGQILMRGHLGCPGKIAISVYKILDVTKDKGTDWVQTNWYSYNVFVQNIGNVFRYDNKDEDFSFRPGHLDEHHKHVFDWKNDTEIKTIWVGVDGWPTLGEVIEETREWYWENFTELGSDYPTQENLNLIV